MQFGRENNGEHPLREQTKLREESASARAAIRGASREAH